jgi:hypothetical protein
MAFIMALTKYINEDWKWKNKIWHNRLVIYSIIL